MRVLLGAILAAATAAAPLEVPYVPQQKDTCGPAALAMVLAYWGHEGLHDELARDLQATELKGVAGSRLQAAAEQRGFRAWAFAGDPSHLRRMIAAGRPVIVAWDMGKSRKHDVVVVGADDHGYVVHDPALGAGRHVAEDVFAKRWAGAGRWALLVLPR